MHSHTLLPCDPRFKLLAEKGIAIEMILPLIGPAILALWLIASRRASVGIYSVALA